MLDDSITASITQGTFLLANNPLKVSGVLPSSQGLSVVTVLVGPVTPLGHLALGYDRAWASFSRGRATPKTGGPTQQSYLVHSSYSARCAVYPVQHTYIVVCAGCLKMAGLGRMILALRSLIGLEF